MTYPRSFSHIGITVTDLDRAVEFYTQVMGWYLIMPATTITEDDSSIGMMCNDVFGPGWGRFVSRIYQRGIKSGLSCSSFPIVNSERTILNSGKPACFTSVCKIRMLKAWQHALWLPAVSSVCQYENTIRGKAIPYGLHGGPVWQYHRNLQPQL
ncbi:VOC family protein [Edwardsiella piscicida]|nr:VOC family protein [Edwardsiella piscicida]